MVSMHNEELETARRLIAIAFQEDLAEGCDVTTESLVPEDAKGHVRVVARESGVLAGNMVAQLAFLQFDSSVRYTPRIPDGTPLTAGDVIADITGSMRSLLICERTALNFLTLLSGTASLTAAFVQAVAGTEACILDTRKTLPGLRGLQKYAVRCGGGVNHRIGLYDAVLIKDNHLAWWTASGKDLGEAVQHAREESRRIAQRNVIVEIEVDTLEQLKQVLPAAPDIVLLDNMSLSELSTAVDLRNQQNSRSLLEASGGVNLQTVAGIAATGVERISVGALTHSAKALDIGFDWAPEVPLANG